MNEILLKSIVPEFTKKMIQESSSIFKDVKAEYEFFINNGLTEYFYKQQEKYAHIKTLLHRSMPVYFYDVYVPLTLKSLVGKKDINTHSVNDVFFDSQYITVIGDAGSGKSTLIKHLFLNTIEEKFGIPILIELRNLNKYEKSLEEFISEKIFENKLSSSVKILTRL
jgi:predicted NACHT family NTPase